MNDNSQQIPTDMQNVIGHNTDSTTRRRWQWGMATLVLVLIVVIAYPFFSTQSNHQLKFKTAQVEQGNLTVKVTATGVLQPVNQVEVGTEISGTVKQVMVDFNDHVKVGQVMARLDTEQLQAKLRQSQAALVLAKAKVKDAEATVIETRNNLKRAEQVRKKGLNTQEEKDAAEAAFARAQASLASTKAQVVQAQAQLDSDRTSLSKAQIVSPIDGIVLKRQIEPGQTVAASLQTPVLFVLAENLAQMELHVSVDEADVGQVREGQSATFTVDAYPNLEFPAKITQVRYAPQTVEGVVTYETVLSLDNSKLLLRPGMTATADIVVQQLHDVLLVPNAALRFKPPVTNGRKSKRSGGLVASLFTRHPHRSEENKRVEASKANKAKQEVWILKDGQPKAIKIQTGVTDGKMTQVLKGKLSPGMDVLVDVESSGK